MLHRFCLVAATIFSVAAHPASGQITVTWTGATFDRNYSNPLNWDPPIVPINNGANSYHVVIPAGSVVLVDAGITTDFMIDSLALAEDSEFQVNFGRTLTVGDDSQVHGSVGATFLSRYESTSASSTHSAMFLADSGGTVRSGTIAYSTRDLRYPADRFIRANGQDSVVDLSNLLFLEYGMPNEQNPVQIVARQGGSVDLSNLRIVQPSAENALRFESDGIGSSIEIPLLSSINDGRVVFKAKDGGQINLLTLSNLDGAEEVQFIAEGKGASLDLRSLTTLGSGEFRSFQAVDGGHIDASNLVSPESVSDVYYYANQDSLLDISSLVTLIGGGIRISGSGDLRADSLTLANGSVFITEQGGQLSLPGIVTQTTGNQFHNSVSEIPLIHSENPGSLIDLPSMTSLFFGDDGNNHEFQVYAESGGSINLSALDSITATGHQDLDFLAEGQGARITLGPLTQLSLPSLRLLASDGAHIDASELSTLGTISGHFDASGNGSKIDLSGLTTLGSGEDVNLRATGSSMVDASNLISLGPIGSRDLGAHNDGVLDISSLASLENARIRVSDNGRIRANAAVNADGAEIFMFGDGSFLSLPLLTSYDTGDEIRDPIQAVFTITSEGGLLDLSNVVTLSYGRPGASSLPTYKIEADRGEIDLSGLNSMLATGNQSMRFESGSEGSLIRLGELGQVPVSSASFQAHNEGVIEMRSLGLAQSTEIVGGNGGVIRIRGNLSYLDGRMEFDQASRLVIGGAFLNADTDESRFEMTDAVVQLTAKTSGPHTIEAASLDNGINADTSFNDGNFGLGTLIVGEPDRKLYLHLLDALDNGNRISDQPETFYLFGAGGMNGLELLGGSRLYIYDIQVYASINGVLTNLQSLFPEGATEYALGDGYVVIPAPSAIALPALLIGFRSRRRPN